MCAGLPVAVLGLGGGAYTTNIYKTGGALAGRQVLDRGLLYTP